MAQQYAAGAFIPENVVVAEAGGRLVGILHIFDCGFPWAKVDGWYLDPRYRTYSNALRMGRFAEEALRRRGVLCYMTYAPERLARVLEHEGLVRINEPFVLLGRRLRE